MTESDDSAKALKKLGICCGILVGISCLLNGIAIVVGFTVARTDRVWALLAPIIAPPVAFGLIFKALGVKIAAIIAIIVFCIVWLFGSGVVFSRGIGTFVDGLPRNGTQ